jgi:hypothetical protein
MISIAAWANYVSVGTRIGSMVLASLVPSCMEPGLDDMPDGAETSMDSGTETSMDSGTETSTDSGTEACADPGADPGTEACADPGTELGCNLPGASWRAPVLLEHDADDVDLLARLAVGTDGTVTAVWRQEGSTRDRLGMNRNVAGVWQSPVWLEPADDEAEWIVGLDIAAGAGEQAIVAWQQLGGIGDDSWLAHLDAGASSVEHFQPFDQPCEDPHVAMNESGDAVVAWTRWGGVWARVWDAGCGTWTDAVVLMDVPGSTSLDAVIDPDGNATVVWNWDNDDSTLGLLLASRFDAAAGTWGAPVIPSLSVGGYIWPPLAVTDPCGNVTVTWRENNPGVIDTDVRAIRFEVASNTWTSPTTLGQGGDPEIAVASTGVVIVVWQFEDLLAAVHDPDDGWSEPILVEEGDDYHPNYHKVGLDKHGCATVIWAEDQSPNQNDHEAFAVRLDVHSKSVESKVLLDGGLGRSFTTALVVDGDGAATAAWIREPEGWDVSDAFSTRFE